MNAAPMQRPTLEQLWAWLEEVPDPEIPVISIVDLGIVRDVAWKDAVCVVTITPTYSGCPAMTMISDEISRVFTERGVMAVKLETRLSPAWTTDWMTPRGKANLREYGIAPPMQSVIEITGIGRNRQRETAVPCPRCGSGRTQVISQFGSTACKALFRCDDCLEPFDYFKSH